MSTSNTAADLITPGVFRDMDRIEAWFTLKNSERIHPDRSIPGLNLGFNTGETEQIVDRNRNQLFKQLESDPECVAFGEQVHGNRVRVVTSGGRFPNTDGLVTRIPGLTLAIQVADCAAILIGDPSNGVVGAVHAGWRGAAGDILPAAIERMVGEGAVVKHIRAYISPCISLNRFEVGEEVAAQFPDRYVDRTSFRKPHIDLKNYLFHQMRDMGIEAKNIEVDGGCTMSDPRFYSYRREGQESGRMLGLIRMKEKGE